jgi:lipopolysaccharide exporter
VTPVSLNLYKQLSSSLFARNVAVLSIGTAVAQSIGILVTPILSRIFTPADYGLVALYGAVVAICATVITLRYEIRVLLPETDHEAKNIVILVAVLALVMGGLFIAVSLVMPESLRQWMGLSDLGSWLSVAVAASIATAIIGVISNWFNRRAEYKTMAALRIAQALIGATCGLTAGFLAVHNGLLYAQVVALVLALMLFLYFGYQSLNHRVSPPALLAAAITHRSAPVYLLPTALLDVFTLQLPFILITLWFSSEATGQYRMAYAILGLPGALVGGAIAQVFFQRFSAVWPDADAAKALLVKTWKTLAIFGLAPLIVVMLFGEQIFRIGLGQSWGQAGLMAAVLAPMVFASLISSPTSTTFIVMGLERRILLFGLAVVLYRPLCLYIGYRFDSLYLGLTIFVLVEVLQILIFQYIALQRINSVSRLNRFDKGLIHNQQITNSTVRDHFR